MNKERRLRRVRLGCWVWGLMGAMLLAGQVGVCEANGFSDSEGRGLVAGIVSKMVAPGEGVERVAGAKVTVEKEVWGEETPGDGEGGLTLVPMPELSVETDGEGFYAIKSVPVGSYRLSVAAAGLGARTDSIWIDAGHTAVLDVVLVKEHEAGVGTIKGTVISGEGSDSVGQPIVGATIDVRPPAPLQGQSFSTLTDTNGRYSLNVPTGFQDVSMWIEGYESLLKAVEVGADRTLEVNLVPAAFVEEPYEGD